MPLYLMALDAGTTSNRCILFDRAGNVCSMAQKSLPSLFPRPGWVEHDAEEIWSVQLEVAQQAMRNIGAAASDIAAIGMTNQRETTVVWDRKTGRPIGPALVWQCRRTAGYCDSLKSGGLVEPIRRKTGLILDAYFSATKLRWILEQTPGARERAKRGAAFWHGGDVADLETHRRAGSCDGLFQRLSDDVVQHSYSAVGCGNPGYVGHSFLYAA